MANVTCRVLLPDRNNFITSFLPRNNFNDCIFDYRRRIYDRSVIFGNRLCNRSYDRTCSRCFSRPVPACGDFYSLFFQHTSRQVDVNSIIMKHSIRANCMLCFSVVSAIMGFIFLLNAYVPPYIQVGFQYSY